VGWEEEEAPSQACCPSPDPEALLRLLTSPGGEEGCGAGAVAASRLGAREEDEEEGAAVAAAAVLRAPHAMSSGPADDPAVADRR